MKSIFLFLLFPIVAYGADETKIACDLERSKAEVNAAVLAAPAAIASMGQDPSTGVKAMNLGITQSFSGKHRANLIREAAEAKCNALRSTIALDEHSRWAQTQIQHDAAKAQLNELEIAINLAYENLRLLTTQFEANLITINQLTDVRSQLVSLEGQRSDLLGILGTVTLTPPNTNIAQLLQDSRSNEARAAGLIAKSNAEAGWDVQVTAGARQPIGTGNATPFATIGIKYSFGLGAARAAAIAVQTETGMLLDVQGGGYAQTVLRQRDTIRNLIQTERARQTVIQGHMKELTRVLASIKDLDTLLANNTRRAMQLDSQILVAESIGISTRIAGYEDLLQKLQ